MLERDEGKEGVEQEEVQALAESLRLHLGSLQPSADHGTAVPEASTTSGLQRVRFPETLLRSQASAKDEYYWLRTPSLERIAPIQTPEYFPHRNEPSPEILPPVEHARGRQPDRQRADGPPLTGSRGLRARTGASVREDFPALNQKVNGHPLVWLDNGATTQKPNEVIEAVNAFYRFDNSNVHRGAHTLAARATDAYENARERVRAFLGAASSEEVVFVRGTTEAINLVAQSWGAANVSAGDEILVSQLEHHSNIVPWFELCRRVGARLRVIPVDDDGNIDLESYGRMLNSRTRLVALTQVANAIGTVLPIGLMAQIAKTHGATVLVDGAQSIAHLPVNVACLDIDFFAFSGHKIYGPTGIGVLWARKGILECMPPWQGGGSMIRDVTFERIEYASLPARFEAGTPNLAGAVGLGSALAYVVQLGRVAIAAHEHELLNRLLERLRNLPHVTTIGAPFTQAGAVSFVVEGHDPQKVGKYLNSRGIAVRAGHHCAQPTLRRFGYEASVRASVGVYNDEEDIDMLLSALRSLKP